MAGTPRRETVATALVSRKGGVGKTTTAVSLAAGLAARQRRVLLVDLDSQASASLSLGIGRAELAPSVADVLLHSLPAAEAVRASRIPGLDLLTASADLSAAERELGAHRDRERLLRRALQPLRSRYDDILLDCPPSLSLLALNGLVASDAFIVPLVPHFLSLEGVQNLLATAERLLDRSGTRTRLLGLLLTIVDYRARLTRDNVDALRRQYGSRVFAIEVRTNVRLAEAPARGLTIFEFDRRSTGARAYRLLTEEFLLRSEMIRRGPREAGLSLVDPVPQPSRTARLPD